MVNRILIRIKVVQMLYAYLLTRSEFKIEMNPDVSSSDKKFSYSVYVDLLALLLEMTGHKTGRDKDTPLYIDKKLKASSVGDALASDTDLKGLIQKHLQPGVNLAAAAQKVHDRIIVSTVFKDYSRKRQHTLQDEVTMWKALFETTIASDPDLTALLRSLEGYSAVGVEMAINKVIGTLDSFADTRTGYRTALKSLERSLEEAHKLYMSMFVLIVRLTQAEDRNLDNAKNKYLATAADLNPNTKFIDNRFAAALERSETLESYIKQYGIGWTDDITLLNSLLASIKSSEVYRRYMETPGSSWEDDCEFWRLILKNILFMSDNLNEALEDSSIFWNDDMHIIGTFVLKSIRIDATGIPGVVEFLPRYKDDEDSRFGAELFESAVANREEYLAMIEKYVDSENWDSERIAFMDNVIMICAIAEIIRFPNIPLPVTFNEYIDIANMYSSPKSGHFINGVLSSIARHLIESNTIIKRME